MSRFELNKTQNMTHHFYHQILDNMGKFKNNLEVLKQIGFFKPFVKHNLENDNFTISDTHSFGDIDGFFVELEKKIA